ncbi:MAG: helix-turn-helix domain-containing protein [Planctomycetia bacterium]
MATVTGTGKRKLRAKATRHAGGAPRRFPSVRVGIVIEQAADALGLHLDEVAARSSLSFQSLNDIRRGKTKNPSGITLRKLAGVLCIPVERLTEAL